jgi:hypothetical protein
MILIIHIAIALSSIAFTTFTFFKPSQAKIKTAYAFVAATIGTGTYLVFLNPSHLASACTTGLIYLGIVGVGIVSAQYKLAHQEED